VIGIALHRDSQLALNNQALGMGGIGSGIGFGAPFIAAEHNVAAMGAEMEDVQLVLTSQKVIRFVLEQAHNSILCLPLAS
jgi:hypothetical protein